VLGIIGAGTIVVVLSLLANSSPAALDITVASAKSDPSYMSTNLLTINGEAICLSGTNNGQSSFAITDKLGLAWTAIDHVTGNNHAIEAYYAFGSGSDTINVTASSGTSATIVTYCFNEVNGGGLDLKSVASGGGNGALLGVLGSTTSNNELLIGFFTVSSNPAITPEAGFTVMEETTTPPEILAMSNLESTAGSANVTASLSSAENWSGLAFAIPLSTTSTSSSTTMSTSSLSSSSSSTSSTSHSSTSTTSTTASSSTSSTASSSSSSTSTTSITGTLQFPTIDASCNNEGKSITAESCAISTQHGNDLIIAILGTAFGGSGTSTVTDTDGLSWSLYGSYHAGAESHSVFVYWAIASGILSGDSVSVSQSASTNLNLYVVAFNGASLASPFDGTIAETEGDSAAPSLTVTNHFSGEMVVGAFVVSNTGIKITAGSGYTGLPYLEAPSNFIEYSPVSSAGSNAVSASITTAEDWAAVGFVIAGASSVTTTTTTSSSSTTISISLGGGACFSKGAYDPTVSSITSSSFVCHATLNANQSIAQYLLRASTLFGSFVLSVNATQNITVSVTVGGVVVFAETGTSITYEGTIQQNQLLSVTVTNDQNSQSAYNLELSFPS
jgi:trimeric autotransporter adhesin